MPYSAVIQPLPVFFIQPGTFSSTVAVHRTCVSPNFTSAEPSACLATPVSILTARSSDGVRPDGRENGTRAVAVLVNLNSCSLKVLRLRRTVNNRHTVTVIHAGFPRRISRRNHAASASIQNLIAVTNFQIVMLRRATRGLCQQLHSIATARRQNGRIHRQFLDQNVKSPPQWRNGRKLSKYYGLAKLPARSYPDGERPHA